MYKRILVPLDGSELAEVVFPYACELAIRFDLELIFLHVYLPEDSDQLTMHEMYLDKVMEMTKNQAKRDMQQNKKEKEIACTGLAVEGYPAEEILRYADEKNVDLILMGTHGKSGLRRWVMGSVAEKIIQASTIPVWLVRANVPKEAVYDEWPERKLLVPLDGSKLAELALPHVEALAKQRDTDKVGIILLRVIEDPPVNADYPEAIMDHTWEEHVVLFKEHFKEHAREYLRGVQKNLDNGNLHVESQVLMGKPAEEIINYTQKNHPNLVVMATHGYSGVNRLVTGSVADKVLHGITSPVLLIRAHNSDHNKG